MFNIGLPELLIIAAIALIVFGPNKLPELAKAFGRAMREFKKATEEVKESFEAETRDLEELRETLSQESLLADLGEEVADSTESGSVTPLKEEEGAFPVPSEGPTYPNDSTPAQDKEIVKKKAEEVEGGKGGTPPHG